MIIWSGLGFLVVAIAFVCELVAQLLATQLTGNPDYYTMHGWVGGLGLFVAGGFCLLLGSYLNNSGGRVLTDPKTGETVVYRRRHSLFFIPMQWWGVLLVIGGTVLSFQHKTPEELQQNRVDHAAKQEGQNPRPEQTAATAP